MILGVHKRFIRFAIQLKSGYAGEQGYREAKQKYSKYIEPGVTISQTRFTLYT